MLVSDIELHNAADRFASLHRNRYATFDDDGPAKLHVMVRLPGAHKIGPNNVLIAILSVQQHSGNMQDAKLPWTEENRISIKPEYGAHFTPFDYQFYSDKFYDLRIAFQMATMLDSGAVTKPVGFVHVNLADVIAGERERLDVDLLEMDGVPKQNAKAELRIEWCKCVDDKMNLEVRVKIQKRSGWPFSTTRPFFVLYRWEPIDGSWSPLYRSEVLTKVSASPHAKGCMVFQIAELDFLKDIPGNDDRPLRVEFFHYKTTDQPKLLGYVATSLLDLRQAKPRSELKLMLNTFPEGELVGRLFMNMSRLTSRRCFFSLQAEFGGDVNGVFVYFDVRLKDNNAHGNGRRNRSKHPRPFYTISRYGENGRWEEIHVSEVPSRAIGNRWHKYKMTKFTERKLNGENQRRSLSFVFWYQRPGLETLQIGHFETTVSELLEKQPGTLMPLSPQNRSGFVKFEQAEQTFSRLYFAFQCELGGSMPIEQQSDRMIVQQAPQEQVNDLSVTSTETDSSIRDSQPEQMASGFQPHVHFNDDESRTDNSTSENMHSLSQPSQHSQSS